MIDFRLDNNDITLIQRKRYVERDPIELKVPSVEDKGKEFIYELKVVDSSTQAIMYYKVNLERVEINKPIGDDLKSREINEDLDVIGPTGGIPCSCTPACRSPPESTRPYGRPPSRIR